MMTRRRVVLGVLSAAALTLTVAAGCSNQTIRDLEGVNVTDPDKARLVTNIDLFPNINAICINGAGFATTTRDQAGAVIRVEEWDASKGGWCAGTPK